MYCNTVTQIVVTFEVVVEVCCFLYAGLKGSPVCLVGEELVASGELLGLQLRRPALVLVRTHLEKIDEKELFSITD